MHNLLQKLKNLIKANHETTVNLFLILIIFSIFFPIRKVFPTTSAFLTGQYSDFTSFSLYLSDILTYFFILYTCLYYKALPKIKNHLLRLSITCLIISLLINNNFHLGLQTQAALRFILYIIFLSCLQQILSEKRITYIFKTIITLASLQSIIALLQFAFQSSIGLYHLGESHLIINQYGIAKFIAYGTTFMRSYGTLPHPNILAALLEVGLIANLILLLEQTKQTIKENRIILFANYTIITIGLYLTFSRTALATTLLAHILIFIVYFRIVAIKKALLTSAVIIITFLYLFYPFLNTRLTVNDQAVSERISLNTIALKIIKDNPFFGTGIGTSMLHMQQYTTKSLQPWDFNPTHNYFLLALAELGLIGGGALLYFIIKTCVKLWLEIIKQWQKKINHNTLITGLVMLSFLILMLTDHYFFTNPQATLLLWIFLSSATYLKS